MPELQSELKKHPNFLIISIIFLIYLIYDLWWILSDNLPPTWDDSWHLMSSIRYYDILTHPDPNLISNLIKVDWYYPPFYKFSTAFLYMLFGVSIPSALMTNVIYFGILLISTYGIAKHLFNPKVAVISTILISLYPYIINTHHIYLLDLGLTTIVTLTLYLLLLTDHFKNLKYSILFGTVLGFALLTKWTAVFFIAFPTLYTLYQSYKLPLKCQRCGKPITKDNFCSNKCKKEWSKTSHGTTLPRYINFIMASILSLIIASIWYIPNGEGAYKFIKEMDTYWSGYFGFLPLLSFESLTYYLNTILVQSTTFLGIIFFISLIYIIKTRPKPIAFLLLWIVPPIIVLTFAMSNKSERYSMPIISAVAIISAYFIVSLQNKKIQYAIIIVGIVQMLAMTSAIISTEHNILNIASMPLPAKENWHHEDIMNVISQDSQSNPAVKSRGFGYIVVLQDHKYINGRTFEYYSMKLRMPYQVLNGAYIGEQNFYGNFNNFDYIIDKPGETTAPYKSIVTNITAYFNANKNAYLLIKEYPLPNNETVYIYRNERKQ